LERSLGGGASLQKRHLEGESFSRKSDLRGERGGGEPRERQLGAEQEPGRGAMSAGNFYTCVGTEVQGKPSRPCVCAGQCLLSYLSSPRREPAPFFFLQLPLQRPLPFSLLQLLPSKATALFFLQLPLQRPLPFSSPSCPFKGPCPFPPAAPSKATALFFLQLPLQRPLPLPSQAAPFLLLRKASWSYERESLS